MLFASTSLAARIERAECGLLTDSAAAVAQRRPAGDVFVQSIAGGVATWVGEASPMNKVAGLGFGDEVDEGELARIESTFADRGTAVQVELSTLAAPAIGELLAQRGYVLRGFENVLGRALPTDSLPATTDGLEIIESVSHGEDFLATWMEVVITGFLRPDTQGVASHETYPRDVMERDIGDLASSEGFRFYLARFGDEPAGGASMRLCDGVAQLCGAATLPEHRRRGVQSSLLATRLAIAGNAGCDVAVVTTQPGSKSQENVQRKGFELLYARAVLVREP